ncbi:MULTISPECIES: peptide-binding protein [Thermodesulfovibrio]|jgi:peptide/nickel transport system substrate-binding protein|uniref:peptide-binding protein n=1 Tax=Thermodesulfovibrio TaxID=28261 RepID=UPI002613AE3E|nr:peptide-binding protein [Thermodesulfovibrio sp.]
MSIKYVRLLVFAVLLLISCQRQPDIKEPFSLTGASSADAKRLLPLFASDSASADISGRIFNGLTKYDKDLNIVGDLAESWSISKDGKEIVFHLRKGIKWHDGEEFTAEDVVFTFKAITNPKNPTPYSSNYGPVKEVKALDKYTVKVSYEKPFAPALESWGMGILPRHLLEGKELFSSSLNRHPVGTGPYKFKEWVTGQRIILERNVNYFEGTPFFEKFISRIIPDPATMFLELRFGGIDFMGLAPAQYKHYGEKSDFKKYFNVYRYPSFGYTYIGYNLKNPLFTDKKVRQAIAHAVNKKEIIEGVLLGYGTPCTGPFPPASWAYNPNVKDFEYSPTLAKRILEDLGWKAGDDGILVKNGLKFSFVLLVNQGNEARLKTAQIIKEQLRQVGIELKIRVLEWQSFLELVTKRQFQAVLLGWSLSRDPDLYDIFHSSKTRPGEFNFVGYTNPEVDRLIEKARETLNKEERKKLYWKVHSLITEDQPYTFLYVPDAIIAVNKRIKGIEPAPAGIWYNYIHWYVPKNRLDWYN